VETPFATVHGVWDALFCFAKELTPTKPPDQARKRGNMESTKLMTRTPPLCYSVPTVKLLYPMALMMLLACGTAFGGNIALSSFTEYGYFNSATVEDGLTNTNNTDAVYIAEIHGDMSAPLLSISFTVKLSATNSAHFNIGNEDDPDFLRIGCTKGKWYVLVGDMVHTIYDTLPAPPIGINVYQIHLVTDTRKNTSTVKVSVNGTPQPSSFDLPPSAWDGGIRPSQFSRMTTSLVERGATLLSASVRTSHDPTRIFIH